MRSSFTYHPSNELDTRTTSGATFTYSHDGNGNLTLEEDSTGADTLTLVYNTLDQMTSAADSNTSAIAMGYAGPGQFERQTRGSANYTNHLLGVGSEKVGNVTTYYHRDPNGQLLSMQKVDRGSTPSNTHYYYISDYMNSVLRVVKSDSTPVGVQSYSYEPYGRTTVFNHDVENPWRWAGGYHDEEVGLYKFGTRYYRPSIFRFTQQDEKAPNLYQTITANRWQYSLANPINHTDPTGQCVLISGCSPSDYWPSSGEEWAWAIGGVALLAPFTYGLSVGLGLSAAATAAVDVVAGVAWDALGDWLI